MSDQIQADYEQLEQVAAKFAQQADSVAQMIQSVRGSMDKLENGGWIGRGSSAFFAEMNNKVLPGTQRLQTALTEAGRATQEISNLVKQAEDEASTPFRVG
ncbi:WXG100 family type VII secretion target [bacterium]|nr:WXG100 family type VII secretion target [bacterium]